MGEKIIILGKRQDERIFWIFQISFWVAISVVMMLLFATFRPGQSGTAITILGRGCTGFLLTYGLSRVYRNPRVRRISGITKWLLVILCTLIACCIGTLIWIVLPLVLPIRENLHETYSGNMSIVRFVMFFFWSAIYFGLEALENANIQAIANERLLLAARESELKHLQEQLNPHFLFNSLNTLLSKEQNPEALQMTQHLAEYLRFSMTKSQRLEPLGRELGALEDYLAVQRSRFGGDLECSIDCETAARSVLAPPMMIQPLLENAFKYGPKTSAMPFRVEVKAWVIHDRGESALLVSVANTGRWFDGPQESAQSLGTGLANLRKRLFLLLGEEASLTIKREPAWVTVEIRIPIQPAPSSVKSVA
jgi:LytS/YehU family sensor histidine kinase